MKKILTIALLALTPALALADGTDGAAQRLPFSDVERGQRASTEAGSRTEPGHTCTDDARRAAAERDLRRLKAMVQDRLGISTSGNNSPQVLSMLPQPATNQALAFLHLAQDWLNDSTDPDWDSVDATLDAAWGHATNAARDFEGRRTQLRTTVAIDRLARTVGRQLAVTVFEPARAAGLGENPEVVALNTRLAELDRVLRQMSRDTEQGRESDLHALDALERELQATTEAALRVQILLARRRR